MKRIIVLLSIAFLAIAGCSSNSGVSSTNTTPSTEIADNGGGEKKVFKQDQTDIKIGVGEKFGIRLPQNPSIGDDWKIVSAPDDSFVKEDGSSMKYDSADPKPGEGGQIEFKFKAKQAGTTTVTLYNCYRCSSDGTAQANAGGRDKRITFTIHVG